MSNIFQNANTKVERFSIGIKDLNQYNSITNGAAAKEIMERNAILESHHKIEKSMEVSEKEYENKQQMKKIANKQLFESQIYNRLGQLSNEGKEILLSEILFEVFKNSLYLDKEFIAEHYENLKDLTDSYIKKNGGMKLIEAAIVRTNSPLLKKIKALCESTANKVCQRKLKKAQEECDTEVLNFDLNEEERDEFDYEKKKLNIDELSDLVKQKVLTVVQDEKTRQEKEEELYQDIEHQLAEDENITDEKSVKEAMNKIIVGKNPIEEGTLFNALLRNAYKEMLESVAVFDGAVDAENSQERLQKNYNVNAKASDIDMDMDEAGDEESLIADEEMDLGMDMALTEGTKMPSGEYGPFMEFVKAINDPVLNIHDTFVMDPLYKAFYGNIDKITDVNKLKKIYNAAKRDRDDSIKIAKMVKFLPGWRVQYDHFAVWYDKRMQHVESRIKELEKKKAVNEAANVINMDMVFAEALTKYTLMETLYTLQLENYDFMSVKKISEKLLNGK